jgi:hypothetical protein
MIDDNALVLDMEWLLAAGLKGPLDCSTRAEMGSLHTKYSCFCAALEADVIDCVVCLQV